MIEINKAYPSKNIYLFDEIFLYKNQVDIFKSLEKIDNISKEYTVLKSDNELTSKISIENQYVNMSNAIDGIDNEGVYMDMSGIKSSTTNTTDNVYAENSDSYLMHKSLLNKNSIKSFDGLSFEECKSLFNNIENGSSIFNDLLSKGLIEEPIYEIMEETHEDSQLFNLKQKLKLIDELSSFISKDNKVIGKFKDSLIHSLINVSSDNLFSLCEQYEEQYELQDEFLISRFIYKFINEFNKVNNKKINVNDALRRNINATLVLHSLRINDNHIN